MNATRYTACDPQPPFTHRGLPNTLQMPEESLSRRRDLRQVMVVIGKHLVRDQVRGGI